MNLVLLGLLSGAALSLIGVTGPDPRDMSTNKPTAEQCAAAAREGRTLPGCNPARNSPEGQVDQVGQQPRFMVCPQDPRCPR